MRAKEEKFRGDILKARRQISCHEQQKYSSFWSRDWTRRFLEGYARSKFLYLDLRISRLSLLFDCRILPGN